MERDWGGLRILMYPWLMALRRVVLEGKPRARMRDVSGERGVFKIGDGRDGEVDGKSSDGWGRGEGNVVSGGWW